MDLTQVTGTCVSGSTSSGTYKYTLTKSETFRLTAQACGTSGSSSSSFTVKSVTGTDTITTLYGRYYNTNTEATSGTISYNISSGGGSTTTTKVTTKKSSDVILNGGNDEIYLALSDNATSNSYITFNIPSGVTLYLPQAAGTRITYTSTRKTKTINSTTYTTYPGNQTVTVKAYISSGESNYGMGFNCYATDSSGNYVTME